MTVHTDIIDDITKIKEIMKERKITLRDIGDKTGVSPSTIREWIVTNRIPTAISIPKVKRILDMLENRVVVETNTYIATVQLSPLLLDIFKNNALHHSSLIVNNMKLSQRMVEQQGLVILVTKNNGHYVEANGREWHPTWLVNTYQIDSEKAVYAKELADLEKKLLEMTKRRAELIKKLEEK